MRQRLAEPPGPHPELHQDPLADGRLGGLLLQAARGHPDQLQVSVVVVECLPLLLPLPLPHSPPATWPTDTDTALSSFSYRFTQIAVDPQVKTPGGKSYDVLFIGTGASLRK